MSFHIRHFFYNIRHTLRTLYSWPSLVWQAVFIVLTIFLVCTGLDWNIFLVSRGAFIQSLAFPAVILGFFIPLIVPIIFLVYGWVVKKAVKSVRAINTTYALVQAAILGLGISSLYKVFTGRMGPPDFLTTINTSTMFRLGFYRGGAFEGWPSSHTTVAFAISVALATLYAEKKYVVYLALFYALYIGLGVSITIHWFSDFIAGAILGTLIGIAVGHAYLQRLDSFNK